MAQECWYKPAMPIGHQVQPFIPDGGSLGPYQPWHFSRGNRINDWDGTAYLSASSSASEGLLDDVLPNSFGLVVFSRRLQTVLVSSGISNIQYLPIDVLDSKGITLRGYAIANILGLVSAFDYERSDYTRYPETYFDPARRGDLRLIKQLVLRRSSLEDAGHIFRLQDYNSMCFTSSFFKNIFEQEAFTGYVFLPVEVR